MSGDSGIETGPAHEAGDQHSHSDSHKPEEHAVPYEEGKENSHQDNDASMFLGYPLKAPTPVLFA